MRKKPDYSSKFERLRAQLPLDSLCASDWQLLEQMAHRYFFTFQELKILIEIALDHNMWQEIPFTALWAKYNSLENKKQIIANITNDWNKLKSSPKDYSQFEPDKVDSRAKAPEIKWSDDNNTILGKCPVASLKTRCCNLLTLDAVKNCGHDCSYCCIQSFFHNDEIIFDKNFGKKLLNLSLSLDQDKTYHIGTGQSSDSLMHGNEGGIFDDLVKFAKKNPNVILELKSKSSNIEYFQKNNIPSNIIVTWSINTETIIKNEEHLTGTLCDRLDAARKLADKGILIGFHVHPMVYYQGWEAEYTAMAEIILKTFTPNEVAMISMGTVTFIKPVIRKLKTRKIKSKILQMPLIETDGKLSYPQDLKIKMFKHLYNSFAPWHQSVFFFLCMENNELWEPVFGYQFESNEVFEREMSLKYLEKIYLDGR
ncbi:MAG: hypothetical protein ISR65_19630 [Bacteriovoracaceae bacterium]|nr:hypothetical protein [Bacteriovoracaceae bacterium]